MVSNFRKALDNVCRLYEALPVRVRLLMVEDKFNELYGMVLRDQAERGNLGSREADDAEERMMMEANRYAEP